MDSFLAADVAWHQSGPVSVKRVIWCLANVQGGVHLGGPKDPFERDVHTLTASSSHAVAGWVRTLRDIAFVTAEAIAPIVAEIEAHGPTDQTMPASWR